MPRQVRDSNLESRSARSRLKVQHKPYFRLIEPGDLILELWPSDTGPRSLDRKRRSVSRDTNPDLAAFI
jgi:hypothetical protein